MTKPSGVSALGGFIAFGTVVGLFSAVSMAFPGGFLEPMWRPNPRGRRAAV